MSRHFFISNGVGHYQTGQYHPAPYYSNVAALFADVVVHS
jgi:hypothetical protein